MSDLTDSDIAKPTLELVTKESALMKTGRLMINLVTNVLICLTVLVSLLFSWSSEKLTVFQLHIILCVLGYQLFMCQGTLVLSKFNSWSMYLSRMQRKHLHMAFQLFSFVLVVTGSSVIMVQESSHFKSVHGSLGILALIVSIISIINGSVANYAYKLRKNMLLIKFLHYASGVLTLLLSAGALSTGFTEVPFTMWLKDDHAIAGLIFITWLFTLFVVLDFWLLTGQRLRNMCVYQY